MSASPATGGALFYVATLAWVGCVADTPEVASWFGDDIAFRSDYHEVDLAGLPMLGYMLRHIGAGSPALHRLRLGAKLVVTGGRKIEEGLMSHCLTTARMAERLGLDEQVCQPLQQVFARWDGKGVPNGVGGADIALPMRLFHRADTVEVHHRTGGRAEAVEVARARRGRHFDPAVVDAFCQVAGDVLGDRFEEPDWQALIASEPALQRGLTEAELENSLEAIADFTDLRSPARTGHSRGVADLAARAAAEHGLPDSEITTVRRAGLVHDLGMHGLPASILDKPGPLTASENERLRLHTYYTQRMLARPEALGRVGAIASMAHERMDGSGYHRGLAGSAIPVTARLLAAACAFRALTEPRAYRRALTTGQARGRAAGRRAGRASRPGRGRRGPGGRRAGLR